MNTTMSGGHSSELRDIRREANRLWRRAGVRSRDRHDLLAELEAEVSGARLDGHSVTTVLGDDRSHTLARWADERELAGRAMRLGVVLPAALVGILSGLSVVLGAVIAGFTDRPTIDPGPFVLPLYASAGLLGYLCALVFVRFALRHDPRASRTVRWLAMLLPGGAVLSIGAGVAVAWAMNFETSKPVFSVVVVLVLVVLATTVCLARHRAVVVLSHAR